MKTAEILLASERYYASVFFSQQTAEKALKALTIHIRRELPKTHNLIELAEGLEAPFNILEAVMELYPDYITTNTKVLNPNYA